MALPNYDVLFHLLSSNLQNIRLLTQPGLTTILIFTFPLTLDPFPLLFVLALYPPRAIDLQTRISRWPLCSNCLIVRPVFLILICDHTGKLPGGFAHTKKCHRIPSNLFHSNNKSDNSSTSAFRALSSMPTLEHLSTRCSPAALLSSAATSSRRSK